MLYNSFEEFLFNSGCSVDEFLSMCKLDTLTRPAHILLWAHTSTAKRTKLDDAINISNFLEPHTYLTRDMISFLIDWESCVLNKPKYIQLSQEWFSYCNSVQAKDLTFFKDSAHTINDKCIIDYFINGFSDIDLNKI